MFCISKLTRFCRCGPLARYPAILLILASSAPAIFAQGIQYEPPVIPGYEPPHMQSQHKGALTGAKPAILKNNSTLLSDTVTIDFEKRQLTFGRQDAHGNSVWAYHYDELNDYITGKKNTSFYDAWYEKLSEERKRDLGAPAPPKLEWELAVHYPPWAQRLLGNEPPRLKIEGRLELTVAYDQTTTWASRDKEDAITDIIPVEFVPNYEFSLTGSVGRLIKVNITHTKQDGFDLSDDPLKNFKVEYKESYQGELEDEIIQEIVAGYTGFDMPGTSLSGYSDKHDGLFGVKVRAKLGPLMLTGVASHAQGEALTRELGGKNDPNSTTALRDNEFIKNRYFFVDKLYKEYYNSANNIKNPNRNLRPPRILDRDGFQVFVSVQGSETPQTTHRRVITDIDGVGNGLYFRILEENTDYTIDRDRGILRFDRYNVSDNEMIAITMKTDNAALVPDKGAHVPTNAGNDSRQTLSLLKPSGMDDLPNANPALYPLFELMWRNVYYMPDIEDGKFEVFWFDPAVGDTIRHTASNKLISNVLGLTDEQGRARLENTEVFRIGNQELILPPWGPGANGGDPFSNPELGPMADTSIYKFGLNTTNMRNNYVPKFGILTGGSMRRTTYDNLGWNILAGTVTVKTNSGTLLVEDEDYELDYEMGVIELISTRARAAETIFITYQRESDFVLEKKVFAGLRGEMRLPFISDNSFMAASVLYQNAATSAEDIPQLGNEPFSKLHLSFNTSLDVEPEWMTKAVGLLPFVKTEEASAVKFDFEAVHSRMSPNTSKDRGAYLDDFERTRDGYAVSLRHPAWHNSHFPFKYSFSGNALDAAAAIADSMLQSLRIPAWDSYWFTPSHYDEKYRITRSMVWRPDPNNARYNATDNYIDVLRIHVTPSPDVPDREIRERFDNSYSAITTSFGRSGLNMENHSYLELVVNPKGAGAGTKGKLMVQIGTFSHDQVMSGGPPNGRFDLEDPTYQNRPELLSQYDKGLDALDVNDKYYVIPNAGRTGWDTLSRTQNSGLLVPPRSLDNPAGDLYRRYDKDNLNGFNRANGTWGNSLYDTENIDFDGVPRIGIAESYYTYEINLDSDDSLYIDKSARTRDGWRLYRIPLKEFLKGSSVARDSVGAPDWAKVRGMRLVWHGFENRMRLNTHELLIAGIDLAGSHWETAPGMDGRIEPTNISNYDNSKYYDAVYNYIVKPKPGEITPEEQSLRLRFNFFDGGDTALVRKNMNFNPQNISGYDSLTVKVYSMANYGDGLKFVMRFGSDDTTYYEYSAPLTRTEGWNELGFSLQAFSDLKLAGEKDSGRIDITRGPLRVVAPAGKRPNFHAITFMALGVVRGDGGPVEGEIWVNDMIATGARALAGLAARVNISTQWADFLSLSAGVSYTDGDFRTMTDVPAGTESRSDLSANLSAKMRLDKFLPEEWGVSLPVGGSVSGGLSRPTVKPQSDIMLLNDDGKPDGFIDMSKDVLGMMTGRGAEGEKTRAQQFETFTTSQNLYTSFQKESESENPLIGFTFDRIKTDVSYNMTASVTGRGPRPPDDPAGGDFIKTDTTVTYAGNLRYDLSPRNPPDWTSAAPFENAAWMPAIYKKYSLNLLPSTIEFDLAEVQHRTEIRNDARLNVHNFTTRTFDMRHGVNVEYAPVSPLLNLSYSAKFDRDLAKVPTRNDWDVIRDSTLAAIFGLDDSDGEYWDRYWALLGERGRTQTAAAKFTPQAVSWMTHSAEYTANYAGLYTRRDNDSTRYLNATVGTVLRLRNSLMVADLFKKYATPAGAGKTAAKDTTAKGTAAKDTAAKDMAAKDSAGKDTTAAKPRRGFMNWLADGAGKINMRTINFDYEANTMLRNDFLSSGYLYDTLGMNYYDFFKYQLGMHRSAADYIFGSLGEDGMGWMHYRPNTGVAHDLYRNDQSTGNWNARISSAFTIPDPIKINISNVSVGWGREFSSQPDTAYIDTTVVLPEVRASASTEVFGRLAFVKKRLSKLSTTSSGGYKRTRKESRDRTDTTTTLELQPLLSFEAKFHRWPSLAANYRYGRTDTRTASGGKGTGENSAAGLLTTENINRSSHTLTLAYDFAGTGSLTQIRVRKLVIPIQGKTTVGLGVNYEDQISRIRKVEEQENMAGDTVRVLGGAEIKSEWNVNYSPYIKYKFTENIRGEARYLGTHKNQDGRRTYQSRFQLLAEVKF